MVDKLAVVGGGVSGLVSLYYLNKGLSKYNSYLFEKDDCLGGRIRTLEHHDYHLDVGAQFLTECDKEAFRLLDGFGIKKDLVKLNMSFSIFNGEKILPLSLTGLVKSTTNKEKLELMKLFASIKKRKREFSQINPHDVSSEYTQKTFREWYYDNIGEQILWFYDSLIRSICFVDSSKVSALYGLTIVDALLEQCYSYKNGLSIIIKELTSHIKDINTQTSTKVNNIERSPSGEFYINNKKFSRVILSVPYPEAKKIYPELGASIEYSSCYYVILEFKKRIWNKEWALFLPKESPISFISEETLKYERTSSNVGVMGFILPTEKKMEEKTITKIILKELNKLFEIPEDSVNVVRIFYWPYALPVCSPNFHKKLNLMQKIDYNGLYLCGDYMSLPSLDGAIESGRLVAEKLMNKC